MQIYVYLLILIVLSMIVKTETKREKKIYLFFFFIILVFIAANRKYTVGVDTSQYVRAYQRMESLTLSEAKEQLRYEHGFIYLCKLLLFISSNQQILIACTSIFIMSIIAYFIYKNSDDLKLSLFLYITLNIYFFNMTGMRQSIAIAIILIGYEFLKKDKKILFSCFVIIAMLFHFSAIIAFIILFVKKVRYKKEFITYYLFGCLVIFLFAEPLFKLCTALIGKYEGYLNSKYGVSNYFGALIMAVFYTYIYVFVNHLYFGRKTSNKNISENSDLNYLKMYIVSVLTQVLSVKIQIFSRLSPYFFIYSIICIPNALSTIEDKKIKNKYKKIIMIITFCFWIVVAIYRPYWHGAIPYYFYWQ